jgi:hypothetical protein
MVLALLLGALLTLAKASAVDEAVLEAEIRKGIEKEFGTAIAKLVKLNDPERFYDETGKILLRKASVSDTSVSKELQEELNRYGRVVFGSSDIKIKEVPASFTVPNQLCRPTCARKIIMEDGSFFLVSKNDKVVVFRAPLAAISNLQVDDKEKYREAAWNTMNRAIDELNLDIPKPQASSLYLEPFYPEDTPVAVWSFAENKRYKSRKHGELECIGSVTVLSVSCTGDRIMQILDVPKVPPARESVKCTEKEIEEFAATLYPDISREIIEARLAVYTEDWDAFSPDTQPVRSRLVWNVMWQSPPRRPIANAIIEDKSKTIIEKFDQLIK